MALLSLANVSLSFGGLLAVDNVSLQVEQGQILSLIGPNGAGKSTIFNLITGIYRPSQGKILFNNQEITGLKTHKITALGISRTFQNIRLFSALTVWDNVRIGCHSRSRSRLVGALLGGQKVNKEEENITAQSLAILEFMGLAGKKDELACNLPYGEQRRLEIARALASEPGLILLDEPAAGMNPKEKEDLVEVIKKIREKGITILLVEHDMKFVMGLSDLVAVLNYGRTLAQGTPAEVRNNPEVIAAYLGKGAIRGA